jgi:hypothetical protein
MFNQQSLKLGVQAEKAASSNSTVVHGAKQRRVAGTLDTKLKASKNK